MLIDTHCHIFSTEYDNVDEILSNLNNHNIDRVIVNGYNDETNQEVLKLINKYENVYGTLGFHPNNLSELTENSLEYIVNNLNHPKVLGVGEIGLDYYRNSDNKAKQIELFKDLLNIASKYNKPVIIHNRQATDELIKILKQYNIKGIIHSFSGSLETAKEFIKLGYKLGINGIVTFKNTNLSEVLSKIGVESILLETDSPYITPEPHRGKKNEPKYLNYIAEKLSKVFNLPVDSLAHKLTENYNDIFDNNNQK